MSSQSINEQGSSVTIPDLQRIASGLPPKTVLIAGGDRKEDLSVYAAMQKLPFVQRCLLVGDGAAMRAAAAEQGLALAEADLVATSGPEETAQRTEELVEAGRAEIILKGNISTPVLNRAMLKLRTRETISLVTLFQSPCLGGNRPMLLTDAGVTTVCTAWRMRDLIRNAAEVAHLVLELPRPRIALLSANEKVIESLPSTTLAAELTKENWEDMTVYGPLSLDLAIDPESVRLKGLACSENPALREVAGRADVLVCPGLDAANILYKAIMSLTLCGAGAMAGITVGLKAPYIILSRADNEATKRDSVALCCIYAERLRQRAAPAGRGA